VNVYLFHQHFHTPERGGALRSYYLATSLATNGLQVTVITSHNEPEIKRETINGFEVVYLPIFYQNQLSFYKRIKAYLHFAISAVQYARKLPKANLHYVMSTPLTSGLIGIYFKWFNRTPYVFETGDLWPDAPIQLGFIKNSVLKYLLYALEKTIYKQAKALVALSPSMKEILEKKISDKEIFLLPNMTDISAFEKGVADVPKEFSSTQPFIFAYLGSVGFANGLTYLIDVARLCEKEKLPIRFFLVGDGAAKPALEETSKKLNVSNIQFFPATNRDGVIEILKHVQAVYISYRQEKILETGSPNKYPDGLAAGKLIVTNFSGWISKEIHNMGCGFSYLPDEPQMFIDKVKPYLNHPFILQETQTISIRTAHQYDYTKIGERFVDWIKNLS
jgi:glycosyltransferase involved in cell wall biosynthesis